MRGKVCLQTARQLSHRITPAHAGKSNTGQNRGYSNKDHPRACGEKSAFIMLHTASVGSPPRMRGKERRCVGNDIHQRITPAHAGKSLYDFGTIQPDRDHPRACGEKFSADPGDATLTGSPPRMRGKVFWILQRVFCLRITPAHAGKSHYTDYANKWKQDHPRACGEKRHQKCRFGRGKGSPPRMRGKAEPKRQKRPAAVDHPRACGEKSEIVP